MKCRAALLAFLAAVSIPTGASAQAPGDDAGAAAPAHPAEPAREWTITVVHLEYADAEELAAVLSRALPPSVRVVPYYRTNSLIIAGDPAIVGRLTDEAAAAEGRAYP